MTSVIDWIEQLKRWKGKQESAALVLPQSDPVEELPLRGERNSAK